MDMDYNFFDKIFEEQKKFNKNFVNFDKLNLADKQKWTKEYILHLISECDELLRETKWKIHRKEDFTIKPSSIKEELIDIFKYLLSIALIWDISPENFIEEFWRKSLVVEQRYKQEKQLNLFKNKKVVCVDIDGVLAKYIAGFLQFCFKEKKMKFASIEIDNYNLYKVCGDVFGGEKEMRKLKHKYRETGVKKTLGVLAGAIIGMNKLKKEGYTIVLLSARPIDKYPRIYADTIEWLKNNKIPYDAIIWDENKEKRMLKDFPDTLIMLEDNTENALKVANKGKKVILFDKSYNKGIKHANIIRVDGWSDYNMILKEIKKEENSNVRQNT